MRKTFEIAFTLGLVFGALPSAFGVELEDLPKLNALLASTHFPVGIELKKVSAEAREGEFDFRLTYSLGLIGFSTSAHIRGSIRDGRELVNLAHNKVLSAAEHERIEEEPGVIDVSLLWESEAFNALPDDVLIGGADKSALLEKNIWIPGEWKHVIYRKSESGGVQATGVLVVNRDEFMDVHLLVKSLQDQILPRMNTQRKLDHIEVWDLAHMILWASGRSRINHDHIQPKWTCAQALAEKVFTLMQLNWNGIEEPRRNYPTY